MNLRHETFIREMIAHGNRAQAYLAAYPDSSARAAYNNACRLLAIPDIRNRIYTAVRETEERVLQQFQQEKQASLAETFEKRILLAQIIHAAFPRKQNAIKMDVSETKNGEEETRNNVKETKLFPVETFRNPPTVSQVLRAIVLDTKLEYGWKQRL
jgi:phage terminase small subunit